MCFSAHRGGLPAPQKSAAQAVLKRRPQLREAASMRSVLVNFATALYPGDMPSCARPVYARCHLTQWLTAWPPRWVAYVGHGRRTTSGGERNFLQQRSNAFRSLPTCGRFDPFHPPLTRFHHSSQSLPSRWPSLLGTLNLPTSFSSTSQRILVRKHSGQTMKEKIIIFCAFSAIQGGS